jgi:small-conductance mechanosensitive channel
MSPPGRLRVVLTSAAAMMAWRLVGGAMRTTEAATRFLHWGVIQISLGNLLVIAVMILVFVLALLLPFPGRRGRG